MPVNVGYEVLSGHASQLPSFGRCQNIPENKSKQYLCITTEEPEHQTGLTKKQVNNNRAAESRVSSDRQSQYNIQTDSEKACLLSLSTISSTISCNHKVILERKFKENHYPNRGVIFSLARELNVYANKIDIWFSNRRAKITRDMKNNGADSTNVTSRNAKKKKTTFNENEKNILNYEYSKNKIPGHYGYKDIAEKIHHTPYEVRIWFTNKRRRENWDNASLNYIAASL